MLRVRTIPFTRVRACAKAPARATEGAAGFDLFAAEGVTVYPGLPTKIATGIAVAVPPHHVGLIWPRSGLATKVGLTTDAGVIDSDYRGEVIVAAVSSIGEPIVVSAGDPVAQLLVQPVAEAWAAEVETLPPTRRGAAGFGSTMSRCPDD